MYLCSQEPFTERVRCVLLGAVAILRRATVSVVMSVCLNGTTAHTGRIFIKFDER